MGSKRLPFLKRIYRWLDSGDHFRRYAPQAAPATPGGRPKVAICNLIPNLGDTVMTFPLLDALRRENPHLEISVFTQGNGSFLGNHPALDCLYLMKQRQRNIFRKIPLLPVVLCWWQHWRGLRFHTVVVLRGGVDPYRSHHLAWLLGGATRVAYSPKLEPERPECQYDVDSLFTELVTEMKGIHEASRGSEVLQRAGLLKGSIPLNQVVESVLTIAQTPSNHSYLQQFDLTVGSYAVVALGASVPRRAWPVTSFVELTRREIVPRDWKIVLVGGPELASSSREFKGIMEKENCSLAGRIIDLTGKTNFEQLAGVCGLASCFVGNDSGPAHIAGACGVPALIVTAFAASGRASHHASPHRSRPLGPRVAIVQPAEQMEPCITECVATEAHCIKQVSVDKAAETLQKLLQRSSEDENAPAEGHSFLNV